MDNYITQISIDIDPVSIDDIVDILERNGVTIYGAAWKATWTHEGYMKGENPISSD